MNPNAFATRRRRELDRPRASAFTVTVLEGGDAGLTMRLDAGTSRTLVGQSPACALRLSDPEVSRRHAALSVEERGLTVLDLGSTNGTLVNGVSIKEATLSGGEAVRLGGTVLRVTREDDQTIPLGRTMRFGRLVGESRAMRLLFPIFERVAATDDPLLLEGEPGTGKELLAEELHALGPRREGPFVVFDASDAGVDAAVALFDGEGAAWRQASGGTLYLAEIGDLSAAAATRLVAALEGEASGRRSVRVVAATRRDLDRAIDGGAFDERLFYLLAPGRIELPPLRDREGDVELLAEREWRALMGREGQADTEGAELPADFMVRYEGYPFPGNLDELKVAVLSRYTLGETARAHKRGERRESSPDFITDIVEQDLPFPRARELVTTEFERRYVRRVLDQNGGNVRKAAEASGVAHRYFQLVHARVR